MCPEGEQDVIIETDLDRPSSPALFGRSRSTDDRAVCVDGRRSAQLYVGFLVFLRLNRVSSAIELLVNRRRWGLWLYACNLGASNSWRSVIVFRLFRGLNGFVRPRNLLRRWARMRRIFNYSTYFGTIFHSGFRELACQSSCVFDLQDKVILVCKSSLRALAFYAQTKHNLAYRSC